MIAMSIRRLHCLVFMAAMVFMTSLAVAVEKKSPNGTNPIVHNYFRQQVILIQSREDRFGRLVFLGNLNAVDHQASLLTRDFFSKVEDRMNRMLHHFGDVQAARKKAMHEPVATREHVHSLGRWARSLRLVSDQAKDLHGMLKMVLGNVSSDNRYRPAISKSGLGSGFEEEMHFVEDRMLKATKRIQGFMLGQDHTVSVEELRTGDMLALLQQVRAMAKELSTRLATAGDRLSG